MPMYRCVVTDARGQKKEFVREAASEEVLTMELTQKNFFLLSVKEEKSEAGKSATGKNFSSKVVIDFTQTMAMLLTSGLSLKDALQILLTIFRKGPIRTLCTTLDDRIQKGDSFHKALTRFKGSFPPLYSGLVKIGQRIGSLDEIFKKLGEYLEQDKKLKGKLKSALAYPILILSVALLLLVGMVVFIFPRIQSMFSSLNSEMSGEMNSAFGMANIFIVGALIAIGVVFILVIVVRIIKNSGGELAENADRLTLKIPVAGKIIFTQEALNFLFAMETLTASGFSVEDALEEAVHVLKNKALRSSIIRIKERIIKGDHLSSAFLKEKTFDERIGRWISIGERSGNIQVIFSQLRTYYQAEIDSWTTNLVNIIEPAMVILAGALVLILIIVFFLPIYSIYQSI